MSERVKNGSGGASKLCLRYATKQTSTPATATSVSCQSGNEVLRPSASPLIQGKHDCGLTHVGGDYALTAAIGGFGAHDVHDARHFVGSTWNAISVAIPIVALTAYALASDSRQELGGRMFRF
jgi:hypothetical protein